MTSVSPFAAETVDARDDLYYAVHKGIRFANARMLIRLGQADAADDAGVAAALSALRDHLAMGLSHLAHENAVIHTALETRCPGASDHAADHHAHHEAAFGALEAMAQVVERTPAPFRARELRRLYQRFALFVADDLQHMHEEETGIMPLLMAHFTPAERQEIEHRIVSNIAPEKMVLFMRCMLPALPLSDRREMLDGMRAGMPAEAFEALLAEVLGSRWDGDYTAFARRAA